jgi:hypothetical protein
MQQRKIGKSQLWIIVPVLAAVFGLVSFWAWRCCFQRPVFEGKQLSVWLADLNAAGEKAEKAASVIRNAGTNALPELIQILGARGGGINNPQNHLIRWLPFLPLKPQTDLKWKAVSAFKLLGSGASAAAPKLGGLLDQGRNPGYASTALSYIGPDGLQYLMSAMTNREPTIRFVSIMAIGRMGKVALPAVPEIQKALQDSESIVSNAAADALKQLKADGLTPAATNEDARKP